MEGSATFQAGGQTIHAKPGDFIHQFFEESFYPTTDRSASLPPITEELMKRMMAAAARNGLELVKPA